MPPSLSSISLSVSSMVMLVGGDLRIPSGFVGSSQMYVSSLWRLTYGMAAQVFFVWPLKPTMPSPFSLWMVKRLPSL